MTTDLRGTPPPQARLTYLQKLNAIHNYHTGSEIIRDAGGPVAGIDLGPRWLTPALVMTTSPTGAHDVLANNDGSFDKDTIAFVEHRRAWGDDVFNFIHDRWLPRRRALQPLFTKKAVAN